MAMRFIAVHYNRKIANAARGPRHGLRRRPPAVASLPSGAESVDRGRTAISRYAARPLQHVHGQIEAARGQSIADREANSASVGRLVEFQLARVVAARRM